MAQPTLIEVSVDKEEYSRYEDDLSTILSTVTISGGGTYTGEPLRVELIKARRARDAVVMSSTMSVTDTEDSVITDIDFDLTEASDADQISLIRYGKYFVKATSDAVSATASIGSGSDGTVTIEVIAPGLDGNLYTFEVVVPGGTSSLSTSVAGTDVTINLAVSGGVPVASENTAIRVAAVLTSIEGLLADYTGTGLDDFSIASGPVTASGGLDEVSGESADFFISIVSVDRLKRDYLHGLPLTATLGRRIHAQPNSVTGVTISKISDEHPFGFFTLKYETRTVDSVVTRTLSWNSGPIVTITGAGRYLLRLGNGPTGSNNPLAKLLCAASGSDSSPNYIEVTIGSLSSLPVASVSEDILVEKLSIDDRTLRMFVSQSVDWLEKIALHTYIEPTNVVTEQDATTLQYGAGIGSPSPLFTDSDYDFIVTPLTLFPANASWLGIQTQFTQVLRVDSLFGAIANTRVIDIDLDWIELSGPGGLIQLVPFNQSVAFDYIGLAWSRSIRGATELPNFWHFNMIVGLRECPPNLQELIMKKAAIDALIMLGQALRPGVGSMSLSRDGVSQSVSYTSQAKYGVFTGPISAYKEWIKEELQKYRGVYKGPGMVVV